MTQHDHLLRRYRLVLGLFIVGLILSGVTAFPLLHGLQPLSQMLGISADAKPESLTGYRLQASAMTGWADG